MNTAIPDVVQLLGSRARRDRAWTWQEVCDDPVLSRLPFEIELDKFGRIVMSPAANWFHGTLQADLASWLKAKLNGVVATEVAIEHAEGISEPDVVWGPKEFWAKQDRNRADLPVAPPLVCEVLSPSNTEAEMKAKTQNYLGGGAQEVWLIGQDETVRFFDKSGEIIRSSVAGCDTSEVKAALFTE
jgi:Uma2 family endonuclease